MIVRYLLLSLLLGLFASCSSAPPREIRVSVRQQKVALMKDGKVVKTYPCSTSKFGLGDTWHSYRTPLGKMRVASKIGAGAPPGTVFKSRRPTGEVLPPNAPGRDPIVTRIIWLRGCEGKNRNAYARCIYIHGTTEESTIGTPASYGCIRMKSADIIDLFNNVPLGTEVNVVKGGLPWFSGGKEFVAPAAPPAPVIVKTEPQPAQTAKAAAPEKTAAKPKLGPEIVKTPAKNSKKSRS